MTQAVHHTIDLTTERHRHDQLKLHACAGGEGDLRACYIAMAIAHMLGLDKQELVARSGVASYVKRCQVSVLCCVF